MTNKFCPECGTEQSSGKSPAQLALDHVHPWQHTHSGDEGEHMHVEALEDVVTGLVERIRVLEGEQYGDDQTQALIRLGKERYRIVACEVCTGNGGSC
jgi:hypothetical protein